MADIKLKFLIRCPYLLLSIRLFILINISVIVLRQSKLTDVWYHPKYKSPLYPFFQSYGIIAGIALLIVMGNMAFIGAAFAVSFGSILYLTYGKKNYEAKHSPWQVLWRRLSRNSQANQMLWRSVFQACDEEGKGHLTLSEFTKALHVLEKDLRDEQIRDLWHNVDNNQDGIVGIDAFMVALGSTSKTVKQDNDDEL